MFVVVLLRLNRISERRQCSGSRFPSILYDKQTSAQGKHDRKFYYSIRDPGNSTSNQNFPTFAELRLTRVPFLWFYSLQKYAFRACYFRWRKKFRQVS